MMAYAAYRLDMDWIPLGSVSFDPDAVQKWINKTYVSGSLRENPINAGGNEMAFKIGQLVTLTNRPGHIYMVCEIEKIGEKMPSGLDLGRYTLQEDGPDGPFYHNMPGYLMRPDSGANESAE